MSIPNYDLIRKAPFNLSGTSFEWVKSALEEMTQDEKIGQLFCFLINTDDVGLIDTLNTKYHMGGFMCRVMPLDIISKVIGEAQKGAKIPLLISANLEAGGDGMVKEGTNVGPNMLIAATGDPAMAAKQAYVCAKEGLAAGANYAFAPVIDIDYNFRNPITNTRTYGSDPDFVRDAGVAYTKTAQDLGMAVSIKHFPGDGVDERDQHLVTSVNTLTCEEWDNTYAKAYKASIDAGALTVMAGHIMLPAYSKRLNPSLQDEDIMPATLAPELLNGLLREKLGFNGMIITDAATMAGMCIPMRRDEAVPYSIAAGCDMFLFTRNLEEDYEFMRQGVERGIITAERLDEAVLRILATKAAIGLHEKQKTGELIPDIEKARAIIGCPEHKEIGKECADKGITLVKSKEAVLPLTPEKFGRVLIYPITTGESYFEYVGGGDNIETEMKHALEAEGFKTDVFKPSQGMEGFTRKFSDTVDNYDLIIYLANLATKSNQTVVRVEWQMPMGANCPIYLSAVPTIFISFANPYHLIDAPRLKTFINAYKFKNETLSAVVDKLLGRTAFTGKSPVDAFCGMWDTKL